MGRRIKFEFVGDTSQLEGSLDRLGSGADKTGNKFKQTFEKDGAGGLLKMGKQALKAHPYLAALAAVTAAMGVAMVKATKATIEFAAKADVIAKKARAIGTDAESLQVLQGALELGGVAAETTSNAIQKLSVNLGMAAKGSKMQVEALEELGLTFEQLESVPLEEKIALIADGMVGMTSDSIRAQTAQALLGRGAMDMLAAFDEGGDAIRNSAQMVKAAGIISNETAKESEFLTDAVTIATRQWTRLKDGALEPLIPIVSVIVTKLGNLFQILSDTGVLQATAEAVAFVAEKFIGLTDEVEKFKEETSAAAAVQADSSGDLEKYKEKVEEWSAVVAEAREEQARLKEQMEWGTLWDDHTENLQKISDIERELTNHSEQMYHQGELTHGGWIGGLKQVRAWSQLVEIEERRLADARDEVARETAEAAEAERELEEARAEAAAKEKSREAARVAYAAARKASLSAMTALTEGWAAANEQASIDALKGLEKLNAEEERLLRQTMEAAGTQIEAHGLVAKERMAIAEESMKRVEAIQEEYHRKRQELIKETSEAERKASDKEVEDARQAARDKIDSEFEYRMAVAEQAAANKERNTQMRQDDLDEFRDVSNAIGSIAMAAMDAIGAATQAVYEEKAQAFRETSDRIADIDEALQGDLEEGAREQLEAEKAMLLEQAAAEKEAALDAWRANKAVSIGSAVISTALAVINALTTVPFPAGVVAAVAAGIAGAVSIAAIASEQPPQLHSGGMVPSLGSAAQASDEVMVRARRGEALLSPQGVAAAGGEGGVAALNSGGGGQGGSTVNLIRIGPRTTEAIVHDTLRVPSSNLSRAFGGVRPRVGRHDPRSRKV